MSRPAAPRLPTSLVRRLDRLAAHAHRFHRYAHHPLCEEYAGEVIRVGHRARLCRGCTYATLGALAGFALGALAPAPPAVCLWGSLAAGIVIMLWLTRTVPIATQALHHIPPPRPKTLTRFLPMAALGALLAFALRTGGRSGATLILATLTLFLTAIARYRRRGPQRLPCTTCPEARGPIPCRGYRDIHRRERAFAKIAARWLEGGSRIS